VHMSVSVSPGRSVYVSRWIDTGYEKHMEMFLQYNCSMREKSKDHKVAQLIWGKGKGRERKGKERKGRERKGKERKGKERNSHGGQSSHRIPITSHMTDIPPRIRLLK